MSEKSEPEQFRKLFIGGLNYKSTEESLKSHFEQWGEIVDCVVMRDPHTRKSRGFGFITYKYAHMVDDAQAARPHKIDGREVEPKRAVPREDSGKPEAQVTVNKLYVTGVTDDISEDDLQEYFGSYGNIVSVHTAVDKNTGKRRGFAFVEFDDYDPVDKIVLQRHNCKGKKLEVKKALSRDEMNAIKMKKEMGGFGRGRGGAAGGGGGRGEWRTADEFDRGSYGGGGGYGSSYNSSYGGGYGGDGYSAGYGNGGGSSWNDSYGDSYSSGGTGGGGGGWGSNFGSSYGGGPMRGSSTGYSQRSQGPYGGGRGGSGGYGRR